MTVTLLPHPLYVEDDALRVLVPEGVRDVGAGLGEGAVGTPGPHQEEPPEHIQGRLVAVRDRLLLRGLLVKPRLPTLLIASHLSHDRHMYSIFFQFFSKTHNIKKQAIQIEIINHMVRVKYN